MASSLRYGLFAATIGEVDGNSVTKYRLVKILNNLRISLRKRRQALRYEAAIAAAASTAKLPQPLQATDSGRLVLRTISRYYRKDLLLVPINF